MPARVHVYCKQPVSHLTVDDLTRELHDADLMTLTEALELPEGEEEAVDEVWRRYRAEPEHGPINGLTLHWHATQRPIQVRAGPPLDGEIDETLDNLPESTDPRAAQIRAHLAESREVVAFELGIDGSFHVAATIVEVLAFYVAEVGDGVVWFYHREFASPMDRGEALWKTST